MPPNSPPAAPSRAVERLWQVRHLRWALFLFALALAARLAWVIFANRTPLGFNDPIFYDALARGVADGKGYTHPFFDVPTAYFPPGFPALLGLIYCLFGPRIILALLLNAVLGAATVVLTAELARRLAGDAVAVVSGILLALFPSQVFYTAALLSEVLFTFLLMACLLALLAKPWCPRGIGRARLVTGGLLLGAATMVRPVVLLVPLLLLLSLLWPLRYWKARALAQAGVVVLAVGLFVVPWTVRNAVRFDTFVLVSTNGGEDFYMGNHEGATGEFRLTEKLEGLDDVSYSEREITAYRRSAREGLEFVAGHPGDALDLIPDKFGYLMQKDDDGLRAVESYDEDPFIGEGLRDGLSVTANVYYFSTLGLAGLGIVLWLGRPEVRRSFLLLVIAYLLAVPLVFFGDPRFHFPVIPLACVLAATALTAIGRGLAGFLRRPRSSRA